ncbi:MAG: hypothetical protein Q9162_007529 [Coniocarpon cinnabarinum]
MTGLGSVLWRKFRVYQVFGANTNVGKTIFSTLLCRSAQALRQPQKVWYLKPVSTGPIDDADKWHLDRFARGVDTQDFYQFDAAVSPHVAAAQHNVQDSQILSKLSRQIKLNAEQGPGFMLVETAGGPHSPGPSGTSQADMFRPLRLPLIFVADWRLGGISTSISSYEALRMRGYDVDGVAVFKDTTYQNYDYFRRYFKTENIPVMTAPTPPTPSEMHDHSSMSNYYLNVENSSEENDGTSISQFSRALAESHDRRIDRLDSMASTAHKHVWWPFEQHSRIDPSRLNVIDSAYQDYFHTYATRSPDTPPGRYSENGPPLLRCTVDGSASWWTQGLGHANTRLAAAAANAAGRYGHVMFASGVHEPALSLMEKLLVLLENPRLQRVFFSDNGSTGMEVAVKMGLKAAAARYGWHEEDSNIEILGLRNSYHGDTIGAMDMTEPSVFNGKVSWYRGRGHWFDFPTVKMQKGIWVVEKPTHLEGDLGTTAEFPSLSSIFDSGRDFGQVAAVYEAHIRRELKRLTQDEQRRFGALVLEPVVLGAGGMMLVDPLFQRTLVNVVRSTPSLFSPNIQAPRLDPTAQGDWNGLPVIADEVFAGLYRLGHRTASSLIHVHPDISVHAKLLTGGLLPLAVTIASESIFEAALSPSKADALLHGHSYTAHPVGCAVANESLEQLLALDEGGAWDSFKMDWSRSRSMSSEIVSALKDVVKNAAPSAEDNAPAEPPLPIWSTWSSAFVSALSHATSQVQGVWALGTVLSIEFRDESGSGYTSDAAASVQRKLLEDPSVSGWNIHSRVLGNVLYLMASQVTTEDDVRMWEGRLREVLQI